MYVCIFEILSKAFFTFAMSLFAHSVLSTTVVKTEDAREVEDTVPAWK